MRIAHALFALLLLAAAPALAADVEGTIASVDQEQMTITLESGDTFRLPAEIDMSTVAEGKEVVIAYQENADGVNQITDMVWLD